jgi:hypothetical protein
VSVDPRKPPAWPARVLPLPFLTECRAIRSHAERKQGSDDNFDRSSPVGATTAAAILYPCFVSARPAA